MKKRKKLEYINVFKEAFSLEDSVNVEEIEFNQIEQWDSVGHMALMAELETAFDFSLETDDIIDFSSFKKGIKILEKYHITFD